MLFVTTFRERISQLGKNMTNVMDASTNLKDSQAFKELLNVRRGRIISKYVLSHMFFALDHFDGW